ncbi:MAG TPA: FG-GAP-like repeat-containing protein, partial [Planctomycetota bacterium]|nr:FG-GAP-like repeat-containing protein [Planctomycetota bacterium]
QPYSAGIWHLEVGDFNGDSLIDLVGVARGGAHVVLLNQGFRTFDVSPVLTREPAGHMLAVGDFDGDTKDDLAIGNSIYCSIFFGKGDGTFEDEVIGELEHDGEYLSGHRFRAADIDGDGRDDLFATAGRSVLGYLGRDISRSTGIPHVPSFALPVRGNARFLEIADVNADGLLDIAVLAGAERGSVTRVFFGASGEAGPTFVVGDEIPTELSPQGSVLAVGDLNGDGARELVITTEDFPWQARLLTNDANCAGKAAARGDGNLDGGVNVSDAVAVLGFLFSGGSLPCPAAAEVNGDDTLNLSDPVYLLGYLFLGGSPPVGSELVDCK